MNAREGWRGFLWQGRFSSAPLDEAHLLAGARYVELNPVRAHLAKTPQAWPWSSAAAHLAGRDDELVSVEPLLSRVPDWAGFLAAGLQKEEHEALQRAADGPSNKGWEAAAAAVEMAIVSAALHPGVPSR